MFQQHVIDSGDPEATAKWMIERLGYVWAIESCQEAGKCVLVDGGPSFTVIQHGYAGFVPAVVVICHRDEEHQEVTKGLTKMDKVTADGEYYHLPGNVIMKVKRPEKRLAIAA